jgi:hypothetical protein
MPEIEEASFMRDPQLSEGPCAPEGRLQAFLVEEVSRLLDLEFDFSP